MAENSKIQWTHHTFNPWRGCARVSPGCVHCYAETLSKRNPKTLGTWGVDGARVVASDAYWKQPLRWNDAAAAKGERHRVFCASLADVGEDRPDLVAPRKRLQTLIWKTPDLDWLLLTKRPENMARLFDAEVLKLCWVGTTCEDQQRADERLPHLLRLPARVRFISAEPLLGAVDLSHYLGVDERNSTAEFRDANGWGYNDWSGGFTGPTNEGDSTYAPEPGIHWVIVGVEKIHAGKVGRNGDGYEAHARGILRQCVTAGVAAFHKQMPVDGKVSGEPHEWPALFRVRQFPEARA